MGKLRRTKILRTAATIACAIASAALAVGWMRSTNHHNSLYFVPTNMSTVYRVEAYDGVVHCSRTKHTRPIFEAGLVLGSRPIRSVFDSKPNHDYAGPSLLNFQWIGPWGNLHTSTPYWFLALAPLAAGSLLNWRTVTRFNLRHILAAVAIVAVVLTVGQWLSKAGGEWQYLVW
jgi:hypothetical protein